MQGWSVRTRGSLINQEGAFLDPYSCARARTVASEVFTEAQSFADCKLHIRTRLLASAFSNFWKTLHLVEIVTRNFVARQVVYRYRHQ